MQRDYLLTISDSGERLLSVINGILDFSKIESGGLELEARPFSLRELVAEAARSVGVAADTKGLELSYRVAPDVPDHVVGDDGRLRQVLLNLMSNAVKFTGRGQVVLEIEKEWQQAEELALHGVVRDTGIGIPPERREAIFEPFTQADGSTTRQFGGTGLGLTISSQIVTSMGGAIWVESEVGRGSAFHFRVRLESPAPATLPPVRPEAATLQGLRILVADDVAINHRILEEMLRAWGCEPTSVGSGEVALTALAEARAAGAPFRLALFDVRMPGISGFALVEKMRADPDEAPAVLMMLSSSSHAAEAARCHELGDLPYVVKPVDPSHLLDAILTTLMPSAGTGAHLKRAAPTTLSRRPLKVLVAEDNKVNQRLVLAILNGLGHDVRMVADGREAVAAARTGGFDVALLDVHMPELDGFEATAAIRAFEKETGGHLPIAAVTARALKGDREACLAAGMDDYLAKPIRAAELLAVIERLTGGATEGPAASAHVPPLGLQSFDPDDVLGRVEGNRELLAELVDIFRAECPRLLVNLRHSVEIGDARGVQEAAHAIKGTVGNFGAPAASEAARALEVMGQAGALAGAGGRRGTAGARDRPSRARPRPHGRGGPRMKVLVLVLLLATVWAAPATALDPQRSPGQYALRAWAKRDGLPGAWVSAVLASRTGYLWLATPEGLVRFDGVRFAVFNRVNAGLPADCSPRAARGARRPALGRHVARPRRGRCPRPRALRAGERPAGPADRLDRRGRRRHPLGDDARRRVASSG